ncbi:restriction endonuclease subunit S [Glaesserella parasuis]|nr:restriction endonuclease subunit S [Glaesserella parasuis]MDE3962861.1 restriction endonuclease subunit S [Glaesserella parasuis]
MSILEKYSLKEICDFQNGFAFKNEDYIEKNDDALEVFRMGYINKGGGYKDDSSPVFIPKSYPKNLEKYLLLEGDIAMAMTDMKNSMAILGYSARIPTSNRFVLNQRVGRIRVIKKDLVDEKYLYYFMNSKEYILSLQSKSNSGVQVNLGTNAIKDSIIFLPSLQRQKYVSDILYTLDEKIALNTQINQTLEQIAQTIFKSWFIDFDPVHAKANALASGQTAEQATQAAMAVISGKNTQELHRLQTANLEQYQQLWEIADAFPSGVDEEGVPWGWEERYLKDVCNIVYGKGLPKNKLTEKGFYVFGANGVIGFYDSYTYEKPQVLIGCRGTVGQVTLSYPYSFVTNNSLVIEYENSCVSMYYLEKYLSNINLKEISSGSVQPQITIQNMSKVKILIPNIEILNFYSEKVKEIYDKRLHHFYENQSLSKVRDLLLPKLLSGEV